MHLHKRSGSYMVGAETMCGRIVNLSFVSVTGEGVTCAECAGHV